MRLFLWGYLKSKVYITPQSIGDLDQRIRQEIATLKTDRGLIRRAVRDIVRRVNICDEREGRWVEGKYTIGHVLF